MAMATIRIRCQTMDADDINELIILTCNDILLEKANTRSATRLDARPSYSQKNRPIAGQFECQFHNRNRLTFCLLFRFKFPFQFKSYCKYIYALLLLFLSFSYILSCFSRNFSTNFFHNLFFTKMIFRGTLSPKICLAKIFFFRVLLFRQLLFHK